MQAESGLEPFTGYRVRLGNPSAFGGSPGKLELRRIGTLAVPADNTVVARSFDGFEVSGGVLVSSQSTSGASPTDGGAARCDWQALVRSDGGTVAFPQGIRGVWDTYTFVPCRDGGTGACDPDPGGGRVPGTELPDGGPGNRYTHVLHPRECDRDLVGEWDAGIGASDR